LVGGGEDTPSVAFDAWPFRNLRGIIQPEVALERRQPSIMKGASRSPEAQRPAVGSGSSAPDPIPGTVRGRSASAVEGTSWQPPLPKPILYANDSKEADEAKALLERYDIDFEVRKTREPLLALQWKHHTYTDIFGIADFIMFAGRLLPELRKGGRGDQAIPGTRVPLRAR
jgi:hypothetical protein